MKNKRILISFLVGACWAAALVAPSRVNLNDAVEQQQLTIDGYKLLNNQSENSIDILGKERAFYKGQYQTLITMCIEGEIIKFNDKHHYKCYRTFRM